MKKLYTSYYGRNGKHVQAVSISVQRPRFYPNIGHYPPLAPTWDLVKAYKAGDVDVQGYTKIFKEHLSTLDSAKVVADLKDGDVLLCYEKPTDFCHRQLVAQWLNESGLVEVRELEKGEATTSPSLDDLFNS